jgi:ParB-like chromosome segregation protein Spo0J
LAGLSEIPVVEVGADWDDAKTRAYILADNQIALNAGWDAELLRLEISDLFDSGVDMELLGFSDADISKALTVQSGVDVDQEWKDMPEFTQEDKTAFRSIPVHFKDQAAVDAFAALIGQKITDKTRFVWFPEIEIETYADKRYAAE